MSVSTSMQGILSKVTDLRARLVQCCAGLDRLMPSIVDGGGTDSGNAGIGWIRFRRPNDPSGEVWTGSLRAPPASLEPGLETLNNRLGAMQRLTPESIRSYIESLGAHVGFETDADSTRVSDRATMHHHDFAITRRPDGLWCACVTVPTAHGRLAFCASAEESAIFRALERSVGERTGRRRPRDGWMREAAATIGQSRAEDRAASSFSAFARDPRTAEGFGAASMIPGLGIGAMLTYGGIKAADTIMTEARKGSPEARDRVGQAVWEARHGSLPARAKVRAFRAADALRRGPSDGLLAFETTPRLFGSQHRAVPDVERATEALVMLPIVSAPVPPTAVPPSTVVTPPPEDDYHGDESGRIHRGRRVARAEGYRRGTTWDHGRGTLPRVDSPEVGFVPPAGASRGSRLATRSILSDGFDALVSGHLSVNFR